MNIKEMVRIANRNDTLMDGTTRPVIEIMNRADLVHAIYPDPTAENGVSSFLVKGRSHLEAIAHNGVSAMLTITAVNVQSLEMAVAARNVLGDGPD